MAAGNDDALGAANVEGTKENTNTASIAEQSPSDKTWATFRARCAVAGIRAWRTTEDGKTTFIVSSLGRTREFDNMPDAQRWISVVSGTRP